MSEDVYKRQVGELSRAEARSLVDQNRRFDLEVPGPRVAVEEEVDERTLQTSPFALVHGESRSRELDAQVEVDQVVLAGKLPVGQRVFGQRRVVLHQLDQMCIRDSLKTASVQIV